MGTYIDVDFSKKNIILLFYRFVSNFEPAQVGTDELY